MLFKIHQLRYQYKVCVYSPDISSRYSGLYISYSHVLELTLSQSHLPGENAVHFLQL